MSANKVSAIILAAGLGTRMKSQTAKVLHEAGGQALVEHVLEATAPIVSPVDTTVVIGHQAERVQALLGPRGCKFAWQTEQKGTGHAVSICREQGSRDGFTLLLYGDCPLLTSATLERLVREHAAQAQQRAATLITVRLSDPTGYGRIVRAADGSVAAIVEQKAANPEQERINEINSGIYCIASELLWKYISEIRPNPVSGEIYLTDLVEILRQHGQRTEAMLLDDESEILGINNRIELAEADRILRARKVRELMIEGVTIRQPETVSIDRQVKVGMDTVIEAFTQILGASEIGSNCRVGAGSIIRDSKIADDVQIGEYCIVGTTHIEERAHIGPFSRLRQDNRVGADAHIGNFVELKNTRFGPGSKAMHLAYLGDSEIGPGVNVGAGTITCNYDGKKKHRTTIGASAFVGSNSTLVAPVSIEAGSYVAAGSVITKTVNSGALGVGRSRQTNIEGWVERKK